jgi:hypothetical protein
MLRARCGQTAVRDELAPPVANTPTPGPGRHRRRYWMTGSRGLVEIMKDLMLVFVVSLS